MARRLSPAPRASTPAAALPAVGQQARPLVWPAWCVALLVLAGDFEFRRRPTTAALSGSIDIAILGELAVYLAIGAWLFLTVARPPRWRPLPSPLTAMWALVAVLAASALWAPSTNLALARAVQLLVTAAVVTAATHRVDTRSWHLVAHAYVALITAGVAIGLVYRVPPEAQLTGRFMWLYGHPVVSGSLLLASTLFLLAWMLDRRLPRSFPDLAYPVLAVAHTAALLATGTRGAVAGLVVGALVVVWLRAPRSRRIDLALLAVVGLPTVIAVSWSAIEAFALRGESREQLQGLNSRTVLWDTAFEALRDHVVLGRGYFSSREIFLESIGLGGAHNAYIEVAVSAGLVGVVAMIALLVALGRGLVRASGHPDRPMVAGVLAGLLVHGLTAQYLAQSGTGANVVFLVLCGWVATMLGQAATVPAVTRP